MLRKTLNKIFSSRVFYILFSLLVAVALWMFVELSENQTQRYTIPNIHVEYRNREVLYDRGLLIASVEPLTVSLTYDVPRSAIQRLNNNTVSVEVDLASVVRTGYVTLPYDIILPSDVSRNDLSGETRSVARITLLIDRLSTAPVPVRVDYRGGTASEDLIVETIEFDPQVIMVSGPEEALSRISYARVPIFRENLSSSYVDDLDFVLFNENDELIDDPTLALLTTNQEAIHVNIRIKQIKDIPLLVEFMYGAGATELNTTYTVEPWFITVSGDPEAIKELNSITLRTINTNMFRAAETFPCTIVTADNITNLSGVTEALVRVEIIGLETDYYSTDNLYAINRPAGYQVEWITRSVDVRIRGRREDLDLVSLENIRIEADLRNYTSAGTVYVQTSETRIYIDGVDANIGAIGDYRVALRLVSESDIE